MTNAYGSKQIEKKCFFFKTEEIYSKCEKCCFWYYRNKNHNKNAHFLEVIDRYPRCVQLTIIPFLAELESMKKDKEKQAENVSAKSEEQKTEKKSWLKKSISDIQKPFKRDHRINRIVDESSLNSVNIGQSFDNSMSL